MKCTPFKAGGVSAIICGRGRRAANCVICTRLGIKRESTLLCDFKLNPQAVTHGKTCDKALCREHARTVQPGVDWCIDHPVEVQP